METSKQLFTALIAAGILGAGTVALAQPGAAGCGSQTQTGMQRSAWKFDPAARADQRLTQLKSELKLTAEQEPLWQAFAEKSKTEAGKGFQAMRDQAADAKLTAPERMDRMVGLMKERATALESVNESFKRLYAALTPEQKKTADEYVGRFGHRDFGRHHRGGPRGGQAPSQG